MAARKPAAKAAAQGRFIALFRGINVGKAKRVAMADLRQLIGELGYGEVRTLLNSGNAVFSAPEGSELTAAQAIQDAMVVKLGVMSRVTVISAAELAAMVVENPLLDVATDLSRLFAYIVNQADALPALAPLVAADWTPEALALGKRTVYLWCANGVLESRAAVVLGKHLGDGMTARNWNTISKLHAMCAEPAA